MKRATVAIIFFSLVGCTQTQSNPAESKVTPDKSSSSSWPGGMQQMAKSLNKLMPYVFSQTEFAEEKNRKKIQGLIVDFNRSVEVVPQHTGEVMLGKDPLIKYALGRLKTNSDHVLQAFNEGHVGYARNVMRESLGVCFTCHSSSQFGPENTDTAILIKNNFRITPIERAQYYVATRQFDKAISLLASIVDTPAAVFTSTHEQVDALKMYLALQVRIKNNPADAAHVLEKFLSQKQLPYFVATDAEAWQKSLREWVREGQTKNTGAKLAKAQQVLNRALQAQSEGYQSGYVNFLRASALFHESLRATREPAQMADIYYKLGTSYESLAQAGTWDLPEIYYEACVRIVPATDLAKKCYRGFEKVIFLGYSGSAGVFIPKAEKDKLNELKGVAGL